MFENYTFKHTTHISKGQMKHSDTQLKFITIKNPHPKVKLFWFIRNYLSCGSIILLIIWWFVPTCSIAISYLYMYICIPVYVFVCRGVFFRWCDIWLRTGLALDLLQWFSIQIQSKAGLSQEPGLRPTCVPDKSSRGLGSMSRYSEQILIFS